MTVAVWIIAVCEIIRMLQNMITIGMAQKDTESRSNAYEEFVKSLKMSDREYVADMLRKFEEYAEAESEEER